MSHSITVRHNFETAHRLPHLGGKCSNLHGHSWWVTITVTAPALSEHGTVAEFGPYKQILREWIDTYLDHGAMLGHADLLTGALHAAKCKLMVFGGNPPVPGDGLPDASLATDLDWPTVENVAILLHRAAEQALKMLPGTQAPGARITHVHVTETAVNAATWEHQ